MIYYSSLRRGENSIFRKLEQAFSLYTSLPSYPTSYNTTASMILFYYLYYLLYSFKSINPWYDTFYHWITISDMMMFIRSRILSQQHFVTNSCGDGHPRRSVQSSDFDSCGAPTRWHTSARPSSHYRNLETTLQRVYTPAYETASQVPTYMPPSIPDRHIFANGQV